MNIKENSNKPKSSNDTVILKKKDYSLWFFLSLSIVLAILSYLEIRENKSWLENMLSHITEISAEILSFAALVYAFGKLYMKDITEVIEDGFNVIAENIVRQMTPLSEAVVAEMNKVGNAADTLQKKLGQNAISYPETDGNQLKNNPDLQRMIEDTEEEALIYIKNGNYDDAKEKWLSLINNNLKSVIPIEKMIYFYKDSKYIGDNKKDMIFILKSVESNFARVQEFYRLFTLAYISLKDLEENANILAIEAAKKCIEIDKKSPMGYRTLGYTYYWFGDVDNAIKFSSTALEKAEAKKLEKEIAGLKNNLAFYYAMKGTDSDKALKYAEEALGFFQKSGDEEGQSVSYDTLGYIKWKNQKGFEDLQEALSYCRRAGDLDPSEEIFFLHQQEISKEMQNYKKQ
jgi:tetratricopeptide (TPR) repeat protein